MICQKPKRQVNPTWDVNITRQISTLYHVIYTNLNKKADNHISANN